MDRHGETLDAVRLRTETQRDAERHREMRDAERCGTETQRDAGHGEMRNRDMGRREMWDTILYQASSMLSRTSLGAKPSCGGCPRCLKGQGSC